MSLAVTQEPLPLDLPDLVPVQAVDWFERFWNAYPRRVGQPAARRAFIKAIRKCSLEELADGLERWTAYWTWRNAPQFIPHPSTWLNDERWNNSPPRIINQDQGVLALDRLIGDA